MEGREEGESSNAAVSTDVVASVEVSKVVVESGACSVVVVEMLGKVLKRSTSDAGVEGSTNSKEVEEAGGVMSVVTGSEEKEEVEASSCLNSWRILSEGVGGAPAMAASCD